MSCIKRHSFVVLASLLSCFGHPRTGHADDGVGWKADLIAESTIVGISSLGLLRNGAEIEKNLDVGIATTITLFGSPLVGQPDCGKCFVAAAIIASPFWVMAIGNQVLKHNHANREAVVGTNIVMWSGVWILWRGFYNHIKGSASVPDDSHHLQRAWQAVVD